MAHPTDALHFREVFGRHMRRPEEGREQAFLVAPAYPDDIKFQNMIEAIRLHAIDCLDAGETFYVSPEITEILLQHAAHLRTRRIMHFEADDFPSLAGMVYFDGVVNIPTILNASGKQRLVSVIWGQMSSSKGELVILDDKRIVGKIMYTVGEAPEVWNRHMQSRFPWRMRHWMPVIYDERMDPQNLKLNPSPDDTAMEQLGDLRRFMTPEQRAQDDADARESTSLIMTLMLVWCRFLKTEIMGRTNWDVDRGHRKMMLKEGRPLPQVRIVTLRRYAKTSNEVLGNIVNWTHRWKSRGHYRMQRVGPGRAMYQRVWVNECIKGPPHLPLDERDTVQAVTR
jgi:hypothetical protein